MPDLDENAIDDRAPVRCPADGETMSRVHAGDVALDRCPACSGIWLDLGELERLCGGPGRELVASVDAGKPAAEDARGTRRCPRDGSPLVRVRHVEQRHVEMDQCSVCGGVFLDAGELRDLAEFTLAERLRRMLGVRP